MRLPEQMPSRPIAFELEIGAPTAEASSGSADVEPAGCCLQVCDPITGCHCLVHAPFC